MLQGSITGRLLSYNPKTQATHVLADGFWYANGVAVAQDQSFVAVAETVTMTVHKFWLNGPKVNLTSSAFCNLSGKAALCCDNTVKR